MRETQTFCLKFGLSDVLPLTCFGSKSKSSKPSSHPPYAGGICVKFFDLQCNLQIFNAMNVMNVILYHEEGEV